MTAATVRSIGVACLVLLAGCGAAPIIAPSVAIADPLPRPEANFPEPREPVPRDIEPEPVVVAPPPAKAAAQPAKAPAKEAAVPAAVAAVAAVAPVRKVEEPPAAAKVKEPPVAAKAIEPPLDVAALKARLRDTIAIGVLAKLSLRGQVDELIESFRIHYEGGQKTSLAALRKPYDALVMKVLDLLQEGDPPLARSIAGSREAIWGILADREKFNLSR